MNSEADRVLAQLAAKQRGIFTFDDAVAAGLTEREAAYRAVHRWVREHDGVFRIPGSAETWESQLYAACRAVRSKPAGISHWAGAEFLGMPFGRSDRVELICRRWKRSQSPGLVVHESTRLSELDITTIDGIDVTTAERVIIDLAAQRPIVDFVERLMQAARRKRLITYDSMLETFTRLRRRGLRGVGAVSEALDRWSPTSRATASEMETVLLQQLRGHGLDPIVQFDVLDEFGNLVATTDLGLPKSLVTIDYDSMQEHSDEFQIARDNRRRNEIIAAGYKPLVARYNDVRSGARQLMDEIERASRRPAS